MNDWNPEQYIKFINERTQPSIDLAKRIDTDDPKSIIDIGCGPGNSTAVLAKQFPNAKIIGADSSESMVKKAKYQYPSLDFIQFDAENDFPELKDRFDVVFSNACIQWVPNHRKLLSDMMSVLNDNGVMAVQVPMNYNEPIHKILASLSTSHKWKDKFSHEQIFHTLTQSEYFDLLSEISSDFTIWETIYMHRMPSHESIIDWYRSTGMRPYLDSLSEGDAKEFEKDVFYKVVKAYPVQKNGEIIFRFPRLFFTAIK